MKIFTFIFSFFVMAFTASAQFVVVNSPSNIAGVYDYGVASFGADISTGTWTGDCVFVDNGTATPTIGCDTVLNDADLAGKIAFIDRGTCSFSEKVSRAEAAGAIAAVVFNHTAGAGTITMGVTAGFDVTIPSVMLSYEDGQTIRAELANGPVNMTIGIISLGNNVGTDRAKVMNAPMGVIPVNQAEASFFTVTPAAIVLNQGINDASNVTVSATIDYTPLAGGASTEVYNESDVIDFIAAGDTADILGLADYIPVEGAGVYDMNYTIASDSIDEADFDNAQASQFVLSENVYCEGSWDFTNNRPRITNAYTISGGGNIEFLTGVNMPEGDGFRLDSMQFYISTAAASLGSLEPGSINGYVYQWIDINDDSTATNDELVFVGYAPVEFQDTSATFEWLNVPILETVDYTPGYLLDEDDAKFFVGVRYQGAELVYFGFDESYDQTVYTTYLAQTDLDLSYIGINAWDNLVPDITNGFLFTGFRGSIATALYVSEVETSPSVEKAPIVTSVQLFPNPTTDLLTVETELVNNTTTVEYSIRDAAGRLVFSTEKDLNGTYDKAQFNVSQFAAGQYFLTLKTEDGSTSRPFAVKH